ncbi:hypothetical protein PFISCL1PPCAC_802, partial [Pristionchus fissidentatus]
HSRMPKVIIAGAGLVGALNACFFAKRGWDVEVYEFRRDIRTMEHVPGRSINLALSCRGKTALEAVGLREYIVDQGVEMFSRLVHESDGIHTNRQPYGQPGEHIVSINRRHLNEVMITQAELSHNVRFFFQHKVKKVDLEKNELVVEHDGIEVIVEGDLIVASDGAYSAVRRSLMTQPRFDYQQEYIEHGYIEFSMLPRNNDFVIEPNVFHLWPRGQFTLIALANKDHTFTVTLFAPFHIFEQELDTKEHQLAFFEKHFPDALKAIEPERMLARFAEIGAQSLISLKCAPHHFGKGLVLTGDAAHAMVPFYGQGMNCGFEDCLVLSEALDQAKENIPEAIAQYSSTRVKDAHTINDLAMYNYQELRDLVNHTSYKLRKKLDLTLNRWFPQSWIPLYSMVTFTRIPYSEVVKNRQWQDKVLARIRCLSTVSLLALAIPAAFKLAKHYRQ